MSEPSNIECEVPGEQKLREGGSSPDNGNSTLNSGVKAQTSLQDANAGEIASADDFTLEPVITVTKQESTFTKGELKLQKVTITEDISQTSEGSKTSGAINRRLTYEIHTKIPSPTNATTSKRDDTPIATHTTDKENIESRRGKTKIPMARFRQAVDRVKREQKEMRKTEAVREITSTPRKSSIPRLKDSKIPHMTTKDVKVSKEVERTPVADEDEFDKIFREINEKGSLEVSITNEECVSQVESSFDEIIHAYEEDGQEKAQAVGVERVRQSRIPMLKRRSEHDIERPRNRERYTIKKSLSVDMDKDDSPAVQTEYTTETVTTEKMQGYTETSTESVTLRNETSYSNDYNIKKRQGITCDENVYNRILITDETFENAEERYRLSKYKQGGRDVDNTEAASVIDEPQDSVETIDVTESYDDISMTLETQLTKISSEQVRFDKQIVSKIYKIDFTENTFELADSETTETSNEHTQERTKEEATHETITRSVSKDGSISMLVDHRKSEQVVGDFKVSRYKTSSSEPTRDDIDEQKVTRSYTIESVQSSVTTNEGVGQCELLTKVDEQHSIETSGSVENYAVNDVKDRSNMTKNNTDSIKIEASTKGRDTDKIIENSATKCSTNEMKEAAINIGEITTTDCSVKINDTEKTPNYSSPKHSYKNITDTASSNTRNRINETKEQNNTNDLETKYKTKEIKDSTEKTTQLSFEHNIREAKETGNVSASLITEEIKVTEYTEIKESDSFTEDIKVTTDNKDIGNSASVLVKNFSKEYKKDTQNKANIVTNQDLKETNSAMNHAPVLHTKHKTKDVTKTTADLKHSIKETKATSNFTSNKSEDNETKITRNFNFDRQTSSQSATFKSNENSYDKTKSISYSPVMDKAVKSEVNGTKIDGETHDAETYKIYSDVFSKMSTTSKTSTQLETTTETSQKIEKAPTETSIDLPVLETGSGPEDNMPILRGKVSRIIGRISSIDSKTEEREVKDVPKKKSILSKIALFERDEPYERIPKPRAAQPEPKPLRGLAALRQTSRELRKPKIVDEIYKDYSERSAVRRGVTLQSENDEEEITIDIKDINNGAEVNKFDSAFKTKLYDNETGKNDLQDLPKTEIFYTQKEIEINRKGEEEKNQEEIIIEIKNVTNETNVPLSDSTFNSGLYEYKTFKNDTLKRAKSESYNSKEEVRNEEKIIEKSFTVNSSTSDLLNGINESRTKENKQVNTDEKSFTTHYESSSKIISSANSSSNYISREVSNNFKRTISSPTNLVNERISTETNNTLTISERRKDRRNELDKCKKNSVKDVTHDEESKEIKSDKMVKRLRSRDPVVQRAISVVEEDLGDVIKGKVKGIISRINSLERIELTRRRIDEKNTPRGSVSERIALFEGKASTAKAEKSTEGRSWRNRTVETAPKEMDDETCTKRIAELKEAKKMYGFTNASYMELRDGTKMPVIALGTALLDKRLVRQVVETAIDLGYRAIDTAFIYGNEKEIGEGINAKINDGTVKREDLYIISKLWSTFHRRDLVERACRSSLEIMGLTYFDLYLIHNPMSLKEGGDPIPKIANVLQFSEHDFMDAWYGIEDLVSKGLVRSAGLSNFNSEQVHRVTEKGRLKPVVNQVECHPYLSQDRLAGFCDAYGMKLVCFGTLGSKGTPKALKSSLPPAIEDPLVQVMAAGLGVSPAQLLVAFQVRKGRGVVTKASSASHLHENLLGQRLLLATGQLTALGALDRHKRTYTFEGMGDTHKNYPFKIAF